MKTINITREARDAIRGAAQLPFKEIGTARPDGTWDVPLGDEVVAQLESVRFSGETISDVIVRACSTMTGRKPN